MIQLAKLKADFCLLVQCLWHSLSLYFQLGCAPSERPECGYSLKKSPILPPCLGFKKSRLTKSKSREGGIPWEKPESVHSEI